MYSCKSTDIETSYSRTISPISIDNLRIPFVDQAEHVGTVRSVHGNLPHVQSRFTAHRKALFAILPVGLARAHRGNPAASLRVHQMYGIPALLSGITTLVLKKSETDLIDQYVKNTLQNLQKLMPRTPPCVVLFLGGHLPGEAHLHLRQLTIFGMICRLEESILHQIADYLLSTARASSGSWFLLIRNLCLQYRLPTPLTLLHHPPTKAQFKSLIKSHIIDYWETQLRSEAKLPSLRYFNPQFMSLTKPHLLWSMCGSNPFEVNKAIVQARMLSGRYLTDQLSRHWTDNSAGTCRIPGCSGQLAGSLEHILLYCPALQTTRTKMVNFCFEIANQSADIQDIVSTVLTSPNHTILTQFLLDCSALPAVINLKQTHGLQPLQHLFRMSRNWCYSIHRRRMELMGLFQFR